MAFKMKGHALPGIKQRPSSKTSDGKAESSAFQDKGDHNHPHNNFKGARKDIAKTMDKVRKIKSKAQKKTERSSERKVDRIKKRTQKRVNKKYDKLQQRLDKQGITPLQKSGALKDAGHGGADFHTHETPEQKSSRHESIIESGATSGRGKNLKGKLLAREMRKWSGLDSKEKHARKAKRAKKKEAKQDMKDQKKGYWKDIH
tara:strand:- start:560 stop:1165 length:606 start_codon:yes stop_codon:yes gene_type:complete